MKRMIKPTTTAPRGPAVAGRAAAVAAGGAEANATLAGLPQRARHRILGAMLVGLFMATLDQTVVSTALPHIVTDLRGLDLYTWVSTAYLLTSTISIPFYGKLSDLYGRKPLLLGGIALFLVGSVLAGLSQTMWQLIVFRGIQGLGGGALFPLTLAVIGDMFEPDQRARYQGLGGAVFAVSALVGPAIGGLLTEAASWHWVFYVNVPFGLAALAMLWRLMPAAAPIGRPSLDYAGGAVFTAAITLILLGFTNLRSGGWTDPAVGGLIVTGVGLSAVFAWIESRAAEPIVPLRLFRNRTFAVAIVGTVLTSVAFYSAFAFLPLWFQVVRGASPSQSGYQILAFLVGVIGSSVASGIVISRTGRYRRLLLGSLVVTLVGLWLLSQLRATTELPVVWAWMFITGVGLGPTLSAFMIAVQNGVDEADMGVATSDQTFFRQVGGTIALAIVGTMFASGVRTALPGELAAAGVPGPIASGFAGAGFDLNELRGAGVDLGREILAAVPDSYRALVEPIVPNIVTGIHGAISLGVGGTFLFAGVMTVLGVVAVAFLPEPRPAETGSRPAPIRAEGPLDVLEPA